MPRNVSLLKSSVTVSFFTLCSRLLGFVRDLLIARFLGASAAAEAFFVAFRFPNMFRSIFAEGAFHVVFVPLLSKHLNNDGQKETELFAGKTFVALFLTLLGVTLLAEIFMPYLIKMLAPGFAQAQFELTVALARITFPYLMFITFVSFCGSILNSLRFFAAAAAAPTLLNLIFILSLCSSLYIDIPTEYLISYAVPLAGLAQLILMFFALKRSGFRLRFAKNISHPSIGLLLKRMGPAMVGVGAQQINILIDTLLASTLATGAISYLYYADRLNQLPLGLIGIAIGTALLPHLSHALSKDDHKQGAESFTQAFSGSLSIGFAAAAALAVLAEPLMHILFVRGEFSPQAGTEAAKALQMFALGLPAFILLKVTTTVFYASGDTKTPVKFGIFSVLVNISFNFILIGPLAHAGLALATAIAAWANLMAQLYVLKHKNYLQELSFKHFMKKNSIAFICALWVLFTVLIAHYFYPEDKMPRLIWLMITMAIAGAGFLASLHFFKVLNLYALLRRKAK